jgi:hypothetical protein
MGGSALPITGLALPEAQVERALSEEPLHPSDRRDYKKEEQGQENGRGDHAEEFCEAHPWTVNEAKQDQAQTQRRSEGEWRAPETDGRRPDGGSRGKCPERGMRFQSSRPNRRRRGRDSTSSGRFEPLLPVTSLLTAVLSMRKLPSTR